MTLGTIITQLANGLLKSILIFSLTLIGSLPLGLFVAFGRMNRWTPFKKFALNKKSRLIGLVSSIKPVQMLIKLYISLMRGTPLMLQLMVVYFGPYYLLGISIGQNYRFYAVIIGFVLNYAAYFAEIYRSGIESMPVGQYEAAAVLGYSKAQTFIKIILPQVIKRILPAITNEVITLVKDTSLAFAIAYTEMFTLARKIASSQTTLVPFVVAGIFYYFFNLLVAWFMERCENKLNYFR